MNDMAPPANRAATDDQHPWLGLASFSEETRSNFHGREEEVGELTRRIQRKLLTVLFGQSGLGKTSILRAGIVPRLRLQGYCPVYVRVDYGSDAPPAAWQIKQAILRATESTGTWTQAGIASEGESLWEFLHYRDDVLTDAAGKPLIPLLIFDQFEEIFTLAQSDAEGRTRAREFVEGLAELVENRPSKALEAKLEEDDSAVERFDFARSDYRVLIALREDYLAHLETLKAEMPSITQNRMRLAPMTGQQALSAVTGPGGRLVSDEVAQAIVRFVAGGAELANAQVEPSLLSLICRELNDKRIAAARAEITLDLLAGSHASILSDFYERAVGDQPEAVRRVIEDVLLTESGYRENVAEERVSKALDVTGAAPGTLALLVDRRLLRIEDRLDIRRVELTHDVLCGVVGASRAQRQEREQHAATTRSLEQQRERQRATRKALVRARQVAAVCVVLTGLAGVSLVFGYHNMKKADQTRAMADASRTEAEKLVSYLLEDFYEELVPIGRLDTIAELTDRAVAYYRTLPPEMHNAATKLNFGMALTRQAAVLRAKGQQQAALNAVIEASRVLEPLATISGAGTEARSALAGAHYGHSLSVFTQGNYKLASALNQRSIDLLRPIGGAPTASAKKRAAYAIALRYDAFIKMRSGQWAEAQKGFVAARELIERHPDFATSIPLQLANLEVHSWMHENQLAMADFAGADKTFETVTAGAGKLLEQRPGHAKVLDVIHRVNLVVTYTSLQQRQPGKAIAAAQAGIAPLLARLKVNPGDRRSVDNLAIYYGFSIEANIRSGKLEEAARIYMGMLDLYRGEEASPFQIGNLLNYIQFTSDMFIETGKHRESEEALERAHAFIANAVTKLPANDPMRKPWSLTGELFNYRARAGIPGSNLEASKKLLRMSEQYLDEFKRDGIDKQAIESVTMRDLSTEVLKLHAREAYALGDYRAAAASQKKGLDFVATAFSLVDSAEKSSYALYLARSGQAQEALEMLKPLIATLRKQMAAPQSDQFLRQDLAVCLLALAKAQPHGGQPRLREAAQLLAGMSAPLQQYRSVKLWRARVDEALRSSRS